MGVNNCVVNVNIPIIPKSSGDSKCDKTGKIKKLITFNSMLNRKYIPLSFIIWVLNILLTSGVSSIKEGVLKIV